MVEDTQNTTNLNTLPDYARLPINRCNLPAVILGSLSFQQHPIEIRLDGVQDIHAQLFNDLLLIDNTEKRAIQFMDYMASSFLLDNPEQAGLNKARPGNKNKRNDYLRLLRGWHFDPDSKEGAVLKSWVESRFGLLPRNHQGPLRGFNGDNYQRYIAARSKGLYNSNALESQMDLLYSYNQFEILFRFPDQTHITLYRGINQLHSHEVLQQDNVHHARMILNNLNSFTSNQERADEFGDIILEVEIPLSKVLFMPQLLTEGLSGEQEYLVIGGVYEVKVR